MVIRLDWPTMSARLRTFLSRQGVLDEEGQHATDKSASLHALSNTMLDRLHQQLEELSEPHDRIQVMRSAASEALYAWHADANAPNHLAIATEPIEPQAKLLAELLAEPPFGELTRVIQLRREHLAGDDCRTIWQTLREALDLNREPTGGERMIVAIPDLSWCFLRCIEGLDAIEALLVAIVTDRSRFWVLGCNRWAWLYLDRVCHLSAYLQAPVLLPGATDRDLKQWLVPTEATLDLQVQTCDDVENGDEIWTSSLEQRCFAQITELATGLPAVAAPLWLRSLRWLAADEVGEDATPEKLSYEMPSLPELPRLTADDRYLLYILGLHSGLTLPALAQSLAEAEPVVRAQLQLLLQQGLVIRDADLFAIAPIHYPRLRRDLRDNHLLVEGKIE